GSGAPGSKRAKKMDAIPGRDGSPHRRSGRTVTKAHINFHRAAGWRGLAPWLPRRDIVRHGKETLMASEDRGESRPQDATLATVLGQLFRDAETLLLQELALFRAELGANAARLATGALVIAAGIAVALIGGLALVAALIALLGTVMPLWLASA